MTFSPLSIPHLGSWLTASFLPETSGQQRTGAFISHIQNQDFKNTLLATLDKEEGENERNESGSGG
jgi:hypothetical protein